MMTSTKISVPLLIDGKEVECSSQYDVICPATGIASWTASSASPSDAVRAVEAAQAAFPSWAATKPAERTSILLKAADKLEENIQEYASYMMTEMGADQGVAQFFILPLAITMCRDIAGLVSSIKGSVPMLATSGQSGMIWKEPYGVCLGIVPWNAPYVFGIRSAATAIATGNTTVLKVSEMSPRSYWAIGKVFAEAGLPCGVLNIIGCSPQDAPKVVNAMIEHPAIKKINFTGSASTGRKIARACGENLKPCLMELGGKNSAIVLDDADLQKAAKECIAGAFANAGQICMGTDKIFAHSSIAEKLVETMKRQLQEAAKNSPALPNVVSDGSKRRIADLISAAVSQGAQLVSGSSEQTSPGAGLIPTVLSNVSHESRISREEVFGPLVSVHKFDAEEEAVRMANSTPYGLSAAVFTKDLRKGLAIARKLDSGAVHINSMTVHDEPALPMGGVKNSGWGRFNSEEGMEEFLVRKCVTWDD